jgi:lipopolysaccharide biosynthesis glycosyltransferase
MRILLTFGDFYAPHAAVLMESIIDNCPQKVDFVIISYDLSGSLRDVLTNHFSGKVNSIEFVKCGDTEAYNRFNGAKVKRQVNNFNGILRLYASQLLPNDDYVIYLDCDTLLQDDIFRITENADLSKPLCAVTAYDPDYKWRNLEKIEFSERTAFNPLIVETYFYRAFELLEIKSNSRYFDAGIMVFNLGYWRKNLVGEKALEYLLQYPEKCFCNEQDALNHVLNGNYFALKPKWNSNVAKTCGFFTNYTSAELKTGQQSPSIIHAKGWAYMPNFPGVGKIYWKYRKATPWPKKEFPDKTLKNFIVKYAIGILKFLYFIYFGLVKKHDKTLCCAPFGLFQYNHHFTDIRTKQ